MPSVRLFYRLLVTDHTGKIVKRTRWRESRSFVLQFLKRLNRLLNHAYLGTPPLMVIKDTGGTDRNYTTARTEAYILALLAPDNTDTYGIVVGSGTNPAANTDYALQTQIAHGTGSGQLDYGATDLAQAAQVVGANVDMVFSRTFLNSSGGTITAKEVGMYVSELDDDVIQRFSCIVRDRLTTDVDVPNTQTLTVQYTFRTTV